MDKGSKAYLGSLTFVAVLGGLLFGYDTAVISGAESWSILFRRQQTLFTPRDGTA